MAEETPRKGGLDFKHPGGKEALLAGGVALGLALLYFWYKNRQAANAAAANQQQASTSANSPTALLLSWIHDHQSSSSSSATVRVPDVVGMTDTAGDAAISAAGLHVIDTNEKSGGSGGSTKIASQSPAGGTMVAPGSSVSVTLATTGSKPKAKTGSDKGGDG